MYCMLYKMGKLNWCGRDEGDNFFLLKFLFGIVIKCICIDIIINDLKNKICRIRFDVLDIYFLI